MGRPEYGLLASLDDLVLRAAIGAICSPFIVAGAWWAAGRPFDGSDAHERLPVTLLALAMSVFFIAPMLALAAALTAITVSVVVYLKRPPEGSFWRSVFLLLVATWAVMAAVTFDWIVAPALTR
jgi:hypothetical protein